MHARTHTQNQSIHVYVCELMAQRNYTETKEIITQGPTNHWCPYKFYCIKICLYLMEVCFIDAILMQVFDAPQTLDVDVVHLRIKETASVLSFCSYACQ